LLGSWASEEEGGGEGGRGARVAVGDKVGAEDRKGPPEGGSAATPAAAAPAPAPAPAPAIDPVLLCVVLTTPAPGWCVQYEAYKDVEKEAWHWSKVKG